MSNTKTWDEWFRQYTVLIRSKNPNASEAAVIKKAEELADKKVPRSKTIDAALAGNKKSVSGNGARATANVPRSPEYTGKAPFRFVALEDKVVLSPAKAKGIHHNEPHKDAICGEIEVRWTAETPFLIGQENGNPVGQEKIKETYPFKFAGRYAIPGATIKGALRNITSVASFSRIGKFNDFLRFGLRDFESNTYTEVLHESKIRAGWMQLQDDETSIIIDERLWYKVPMMDIANKCYCYDDKEWCTADLNDKTRKMSNVKLLDEVPYAVSEGKNASFGDGTECGTLVVSGAAPYSGSEDAKNKNNEYLFDSKSKGQVQLCRENFKIFDQINSTPRGKKPVPNGAWKYWREKFFAKEKVPVFFVENTSFVEGNNDRYHIGLTRLFRIPQKNTPKDVLAKCHSEHVPDWSQPDFVEGLFGYVHEDDSIERKHSIAPEDVSARGRVSFGMAFCDIDNPKVMDTMDRILLTPRPSFSTYYMVPHREDNKYTADNPSGLAGRKRYPVGLPVANRNIGRNGKVESENRRIASKLKPLSPDPELSFTGKIRFHNVLPEEVGAILWALSFGEPGGKYRHSIGRGKPLGFGQMKAEVTSTSLLANSDGSACEQAELVDKFVSFMNQKTNGNWSQAKSITDLKAFADPARGERNDKNLSYPGNFMAYADNKRDNRCLAKYT